MRIHGKSVVCFLKSVLLGVGFIDFSIDEHNFIDRRFGFTIRILCQLDVLGKAQSCFHNQCTIGFSRHTKLAILASDFPRETKKIGNKMVPPVRIELGTSGILI